MRKNNNWEQEMGEKEIIWEQEKREIRKRNNWDKEKGCTEIWKEFMKKGRWVEGEKKRNW